MRREIQNPLMFETDPESFSPAKHFIYYVPDQPRWHAPFAIAGPKFQRIER
jgi:hypothetical protein